MVRRRFRWQQRHPCLCSCTVSCANESRWLICKAIAVEAPAFADCIHAFAVVLEQAPSRLSAEERISFGAGTEGRARRSRGPRPQRQEHAGETPRHGGRERDEVSPKFMIVVFPGVSEGGALRPKAAGNLLTRSLPLFL
jgi:hypothetical protein